MAELVVHSLDQKAEDLSNSNKQEKGQRNISEESGEDDDGGVLQEEDGVNNQLAAEGSFSLLPLVVLHVKAGQRKDLAVKVDVAYSTKDILVDTSNPIFF